MSLLVFDLFKINFLWVLLQEMCPAVKGHIPDVELIDELSFESLRISYRE